MSNEKRVVFRKRLLRWAALTLCLLVVVLAAAYYFFVLDLPPEKAKRQEAVRQLPRASYEVPDSMGGHVSYLHAGDPEGRRVIFVHGTPGDAEDWGEYLLHVPPGFEYIAIDRPGFGESGPQGSLASLTMQATAIEPLLLQRQGRWPVLVGHSLGGPVVVETAADYPDRVAGLVILAGALDPAQEHINPLQRVGEWVWVRWLLPRAIRNANEELIPLKEQLQALSPKLARISCPIVIVHGTKDHLVPYANVVYMKEHFPADPSVRVMTIPDQDHFLPWTNVNDVRKALVEVLAMIDQSKPAPSHASAR